MNLSAPINELKRKAKLLRRKTGMPHIKALDHMAKGEGYASWSILIGKYEKQKPKPENAPQIGYPIQSLPFDASYRAEAIDLARVWTQLHHSLMANICSMARKFRLSFSNLVASLRMSFILQKNRSTMLRMA